MKKLVEQKMAKVEEILSEILQYRSLEEIVQNVSIQTYQDRPGIEHYFYGDTLVLEVEFAWNDTENPRWEFRVPIIYLTKF